MTKKYIKDFINDNFLQLILIAIWVTTCFMSLIVLDKAIDNYCQVELEGNNE